jgi:hypothetical protein
MITDLDTFAADLAKALGLTCRLVNERQRIYTGHESYFFLRVPSPGRLEICGNFNLLALQKDGQSTPQWFGHGIASPSITVSAARTVEQIAKDIQRRFLPAYAAAFETAAQRRNADDACRRQAASAALAIQTAVGDFGHISDRSDFRVYLNRNAENSLSLGVGISGDLVKLEVGYLPQDKALAVINFLKTL